MAQRQQNVAEALFYQGRHSDWLAAAPAIHDIHPRMPVILPPADYQSWLDPAADADTLGALLRPYEAALEAYPVATTVNNVRNDSPDCFEAVTEIPPLL